MEHSRENTVQTDRSPQAPLDTEGNIRSERVQLRSNERAAEDDKRFILKVIRYTLQTVLILGAIFIGVKIFPFLMPIFFGLIIARTAVFFVVQVDQFMHRTGLRQEKMNPHLGPRRRRFAIGLYFLLLIVLLLLTAWAFSAVITSLQRAAKLIPEVLAKGDLANQLESFLLKINGFLQSLGFSRLNLDVAGVIEDLVQLQTVAITNLPLILTAIVNALSKAVGSLPMASLVILVTIMAGYYYLSQGQRFYLIGRRLIPDKVFVRRLQQVLNAIIYTLFRIIGGYFLIFFVVFLQAWLGLSVIKMPNAVLWSVVIAFVDMLPVLGIAATMIPMAIYLFITASSWQGLLCLLIMVIMWVSRRFFEPLILGGAMRLHPLMTILSMIIGIKIYGLGGILLGPTILVILREISEVFQLNKVIKRNMQRLFTDLDAKKYLPPVGEFKLRYRQKNKGRRRQ